MTDCDPCTMASFDDMDFAVDLLEEDLVEELVMEDFDAASLCDHEELKMVFEASAPYTSEDGSSYDGFLQSRTVSPEPQGEENEDLLDDFEMFGGEAILEDSAFPTGHQLQLQKLADTMVETDRSRLILKQLQEQIPTDISATSAGHELFSCSGWDEIEASRERLSSFINNIVS